MIKRLFPGVTYFSRNGFSINEGRFPNICLSWRWKQVYHTYWFFYICLWKNCRFCFQFTDDCISFDWGSLRHDRHWLRSGKYSMRG